VEPRVSDEDESLLNRAESRSRRKDPPLESSSWCDEWDDEDEDEDDEPDVSRRAASSLPAWAGGVASISDIEQATVSHHPGPRRVDGQRGAPLGRGVQRRGASRGSEAKGGEVMTGSAVRKKRAAPAAIGRTGKHTGVAP